MNFPKSSISVFLLTILFSCEKKHEPSAERLEEVPYVSIENNQEKNFYLYVPKGYDSDETMDWPVIMFLHGNGERGNGQDELGFSLAHGPIYEAWVQRKDIPFLIIGPQLPLYGFDTLGISYLTDRKMEDFPKRLAEGTPSVVSKSKSDTIMNGDLSSTEFPFGPEGNKMGWPTIEKDVIDILDAVKENYRVDESRVYLSGLSYGGHGTWYFASKYPEIWAAINPIVGWGHPEQMKPIADAKIPVWCFAGGRDMGNEQAQYFYPGLNRLEELGHTNVRFTVEEDMGHDVWRRVYSGQDIYSWFLSHQKKN